MNSTLDLRKFFKVLGLSLLAIMVIAVPLGLFGPTKPDTKGYESAVGSARSTADINESRAEGAPQQSVVNGWHLNELAEIEIRQTNDLLTLLHLIAVVLLGTVAAVIIAGVSAVRPKGEGVVAGTGSLPETDRAPSAVAPNVAVGSPAVSAPSVATPAASAPPNWFPDPTGRFEYRYWDGMAWTADVATGGMETTDPSPVEAGPPPLER